MREKWLGKFLALREGIPRHDVYRRVLGAIRSELLESCFMNWVRDSGVYYHDRRNGLSV
jgi:hypothetical protein